MSFKTFDRIFTSVLFWVGGTGIGWGVYYLFWRSTSCEGSVDYHDRKCGVHEHGWDFWAYWPFLALWSLIVLAWVVYSLVGALRDERQETGDAEGSGTPGNQRA